MSEKVILQGWECPKCGKICSPYMKTCDCDKENTTEAMTSNVDINNGCKHDWYLICIETVNDYKINTYGCNKCHETVIRKEPIFPKV